MSTDAYMNLQLANTDEIIDGEEIWGSSHTVQQRALGERRREEKRKRRKRKEEEEMRHAMIVEL